MSQYLRKGLLGLDEVLSILHEAEALLADREFEVSSKHIMQLVASSRCSAYDCEFVALAEYLGVPLVTADARILREFPQVGKALGSWFGEF